MHRATHLVVPGCLLAAVVAACGVAARAGVTEERLFVRGNTNGDAVVDLSDGVAIFNFLFLGGDAPPCRDAADTDDDGQLNLSDGIYLLNYLFLGGARLPHPSPVSPCAGVDPTADSLDCAGGEEVPVERPSVVLRAVIAPPAGIRQRSRQTLAHSTVAEDRFVVDEGVSFGLLVEATAHPISQAGFLLDDGGEPVAGNPDTLLVTCDQDLGDPAAGGARAGENLAPRFFGELDGWHDPLYLVWEAPLRVDGAGPLAPAPGLYTFCARVRATDCAPSAEATLTLEVRPSSAPDVFLWLETAGDGGDFRLAVHHPATGNPRVPRTPALATRLRLVVDVGPNGRNPLLLASAELQVVATPPFLGSEDLSAFLVRDGGAPARFFLELSPPDLYPRPGNTVLEITLSGAGETALERLLEMPLSLADDVQPLFAENCSGCHEGPDAEKGLVLVALGEPPARIWRNIVNVYAAEPAITSSAPLLVRPLYPEQSYLFHKVEGTHLDPAIAGEGGRMPLDDPDGLDAAGRELLANWIAQGAALAVEEDR